MNMKNLHKTTVIIIIFLLLATVMSLAQSEKDLYNKAKLAIFDKKWDQALQQIDQLLKDYPGSKYKELSLYYRAKSLFELNRIVEAITDMEEFVSQTANGTLREDGIVDILKYNVSLYKDNKNRTYINRILDYLKHENDFIRYYLAFELSYLKDKSLARKAVPVLKEVLDREEDTELKDRAKLALMRIDPKLLQGVSKEPDFKNALFKITIYNKTEKKFDMEISIPFALAKLALGNLPGELKSQLNKDGVKVDRILHDVLEQGEIFEFQTEESVVKIWIDNKK